MVEHSSLNYNQSNLNIFDGRMKNKEVSKTEYFWFSLVDRCTLKVPWNFLVIIFIFYFMKRRRHKTEDIMMWREIWTQRFLLYFIRFHIPGPDNLLKSTQVLQLWTFMIIKRRKVPRVQLCVARGFGHYKVWTKNQNNLSIFFITKSSKSGNLRSDSQK
jgi:hypothetical protein